MSLSCRSKEKDMVKLQLLDMSDSLPPLSKFTHGYKFDPWQKRGERNGELAAVTISLFN